MSYFNMIQLIESSGIGLVYGLRFYAKGQLDTYDIISYVQTNALLYEYYKQAFEQMPTDIGDELVRLFNSEAFIVVNTRYVTFKYFRKNLRALLISIYLRVCNNFGIHYTECIKVLKQVF